jgi:hypothetical protein
MSASEIQTPTLTGRLGVDTHRGSGEWPERAAVRAMVHIKCPPHRSSRVIMAAQQVTDTSQESE